MNGGNHFGDERRDEPDPYKRFNRAFAALGVGFGVLWLSIYRQEILQAAKIALLLAGLCWSRVPRLKPYGIGWMAPDLGRLKTPGKVIAALAFVLTAFGFAVVGWVDLTLSQMIHWFTGGLAILAGMDILMRSAAKDGERSGEQEFDGR